MLERNLPDNVVITKLIQDDLDSHARQALVEIAEEVKRSNFDVVDRARDFKYCGRHIKPAELTSHCFVGCSISRQNA